MSVSSSNPGDDENEIHDLVLLFSNSRIPRGSDAFQTILDGFLPSDDNDNDSSDSSSTVSQSSQSSVKTADPKPVDEVDTGATTTFTKTVRMVSPKPSHVHWPDEKKKNRKLASSPANEKLHHARLYVKTTPVKPILKHDEEVVSAADGRSKGAGCKT